MKHTIKLLLACVILFATACEKDENPVKIATSLEDVKKAMIEGVWQMEQYKRSSETSFSVEEYYAANQFFSNEQYDHYYDKSTKANSTPWYYKLKTENDKFILNFYYSERSYQNDFEQPFDKFEIKIEGDKMTLTSQADGAIYVYYKYNSITATKDKKSNK